MTSTVPRQPSRIPGSRQGSRPCTAPAGEFSPSRPSPSRRPSGAEALPGPGGEPGAGAARPIAVASPAAGPVEPPCPVLVSGAVPAAGRRVRPATAAVGRTRGGATTELQRRNQRVESYRELVRPVALHYARRCSESCDDLIQVGMLGLIRAAELYRSERGTPFAAFARPHIRGAILHYLRDDAPSVRLPRRQAELQERLQRLESRAALATDSPAARQLRRRLGMDESHWSLLQRQRQLCRPIPLEGALVEEIAAPEQDCQGRGVDIAELLAQLEPRQRQVVRQVVLDGCSYRHLARQMQVSPMTVQRLLQRGLERLRQQLDGKRISVDRLSPDRPVRPAASALPAC